MFSIPHFLLAILNVVGQYLHLRASDTHHVPIEFCRFYTVTIHYRLPEGWFLSLSSANKYVDMVRFRSRK